VGVQEVRWDKEGTIKARDYSFSMGKETKPLGRPRRRWEDNIKMDLQEVRVGRRDWIESAQEKDSWRALVSTVKNFRVP
jgi:hypothetical protein